VPTILDAPTRLVTELLVDPTERLDFSRFSAYIDELGVLYVPGQGKQTRTLPVEPPRTDTGTSEFETRPDFGNFFGQGDFSGGGLQRYFHRPSADKEGFWESEGFDISEPGVLRHLNSVAQIEPLEFTAPSFLEEAAGLPFVAQYGSSAIWVGNGSFPGTWTEEAPGGNEIYGLASRGSELFAATGAHGLHYRSSAGVWDHYQPDGATDLDVGTCTGVAWLKDRLFVIGQTGRAIYEVVGDSTPTAIETLPEGWWFGVPFEVGAFVMVPAYSVEAGRSRIHAYGLVSDVIAKKASTPLPHGDLAQCGIGYLGRAFVGGGRRNTADGFEPLLYEAIPDENGSLQLLLIATRDDGESTDLSVKAFTALSESIVFSWTTADRVGLGSYSLARNAFSNHLLDNASSTPSYVEGLLRYQGRLLFTTSEGRFLYEEIGSPVPEASLVTSIADWNNVGMKTWDLFQVSHDSLVVNSSVALQYTRKDPALEEWQDALTSSLPGALGAEGQLDAGVRARQLTVRIVSTSGATEAPLIRSFSVRSVPTPEATEWLLVRTVRVIDKDRKDRRAEGVAQDPRVLRAALQDLAHTWVTLYEPGVTWTAYVQEVGEVEPAEVPSSETRGTAAREAFYVELRMVARRA
jgi:hypothetical protein